MVKSSPDPSDREMVDFNVLADSTCRYDLDDLDVLWLKLINEERRNMGELLSKVFLVGFRFSFHLVIDKLVLGINPLDEILMEKIMEELEIQVSCYVDY